MIIDSTGKHYTKSLLSRKWVMKYWVDNNQQFDLDFGLCDLKIKWVIYSLEAAFFTQFSNYQGKGL